MSIRMRRPATERLDLSQGDHLLVKADLTAGEYRELMRASTKPITVTQGAEPHMELDPTAAGLATVLAYLLDWSFADADGKPIVIADQPAAVVTAALNAIDSDAYMEVQRAIQEHQNARADALAAQKKMTQAGVSDFAATSTSVGS